MDTRMRFPDLEKALNIAVILSADLPENHPTLLNAARDYCVAVGCTVRLKAVPGVTQVVFFDTDAEADAAAGREPLTYFNLPALGIVYG